MSQGNVASWQVNEGAEITAGDILADIETDKATLPWENQDDGFVAKLLKPGGSKDIPVGTPLIVLVDEQSHVKDFKDFSPDGEAAGGPESAAETSSSHDAGDLPLNCHADQAEQHGVVHSCKDECSSWAVTFAALSALQV